MDLSGLDKGTAAHESTISALIKYLAQRDIAVHTFARNSPQFDAGWVVEDEVFIAEVKSLTGTSQDQQIRLGIGQVLDYAHQLQRPGSGHSIRPTLVLEKRPADGRWASLAQAVGIRWHGGRSSKGSEPSTDVRVAALPGQPWLRVRAEDVRPDRLGADVPAAPCLSVRRDEEQTSAGIRVEA